MPDPVNVVPAFRIIFPAPPNSSVAPSALNPPELDPTAANCSVPLRARTLPPDLWVNTPLGLNVLRPIPPVLEMVPELLNAPLPMTVPPSFWKVIEAPAWLSTVRLPKDKTTLRRF